MSEFDFTGIHVPVLLKEVVNFIQPGPYRTFIDCTVGAGGHVEAILEKSQPGGRLLGLDADPEAIQIASKRLDRFGNAVILVNTNFRNLSDIASNHGFTQVNGILLDLGVSSLQLDRAEKGFSFTKNAPLDMRFGPDQKITAADIVNTYPEKELADLIFQYGEERKSRQIAKQIIRSRPLQTTEELARVIEQAIGHRYGRIHPATRTFQALRIAVNEELKSLEVALPQAVDLLVSGGRLVVISFHSLEDRIVKEFMRREAKGCICPPGSMVCNCGHVSRLRLVTRKPIVPSPEEERSNPRSRSAKLRVAERL